MAFPMHPNACSATTALFTSVALLACGLGEDAAMQAAIAEVRAQNEALAAQNAELAAAVEAAMRQGPGTVRFTEVPLGEAAQMMPPEARAQLGIGDVADGVLRGPNAAAADALRRSIWVWGNQEGGRYLSLQFGETLYSVTSDEHAMRTGVIDYSGTHAGCLGQPLCVTVLMPDGTLLIQHFEKRTTTLLPMTCLDWRATGEGEIIPDNAAFAASNQQVVRRQGTVVCLRADGAPELVLFQEPPPAETGTRELPAFLQR